VAAHQGWSEPHYVEVCSAPAGRLTAQQYPPVVELERFHPALIRNSGEDFDETSAAHVFDVGQNIAGGARIEFSDVRARRVVVRYGERLAWDGTVDQSDISKHVSNDGRFQQDELESVEVPVGAAGSGEPYTDMALETQFAYHGFRYIEVTGATVRSIEAFRLAMDFERVGSFRCSDDRVNSLVGLAERAFLSNWHSIPTDCPHREKNGWTADAHLATPFGLYTFAAESAYRKWVVDITDEQRGDGAIPGIVPTSGWGYEWGNGPAWDAALSVIPFTLYQMRGDTRTGARALPSLLRYIDWVESRITAEWSDTGTVRFGLGDWLPPYGSSQEHRCPAELTSTAYFYRIVSETAALAGACGRSGDASRCLSVAGRVREAFNNSFLTERGYAMNDLTALSVPLAFGLVPEQAIDMAAEALLTEVERCEYHFECGVLGTSTVLHALSTIGRRDIAWRMITQPGYPGYMDWIDRGATTLWESWQGDSSLNHVFFADVVAWIYAEIGGVRFAQPGRPVVDPWLPPNLDWLEVVQRGSFERVMVRAERQADGWVKVKSS
jgi:alpha-L-rhamnosidase